MLNQIDELQAALADLQTMLDDAPQDMRASLEQQIAAVHQTLRLAASVVPVERAPLELTQDELQDFAVRVPAPLPQWLPDNLRRDAVSPDMLRCPEPSTIYESEHTLGCAISSDGRGIPSPHGLTLGFHPCGGLAYQRFYDHGLLRWSIEYYTTGGRESAGHYCDREPKAHLEEGLQTRWAPGGQVIAQTDYQNGVRHGWSILWEVDGTPISATMYRHGTPDNAVLPGAVNTER